MIRPEALAALRDYQQADEEGIMVLVSRQALEEAIAELMIPACPFCGQAPVVVNEPPAVRIFCPGPGNQCVCPQAEAETLEGALKLWCRRPPERTEPC